MPYIGHLPVRLINDKQIRPTEYRKWADAAQRFDRRPKDQAAVREYARKIRDGLDYPPLTLGISERYPEDVYVADGHHRAIALQ